MFCRPLCFKSDKQITDFGSFYCKGLIIGALDKKDILILILD